MQGEGVTRQGEAGGCGVYRERLVGVVYMLCIYMERQVGVLCAGRAGGCGVYKERQMSAESIFFYPR